MHFHSIRSMKHAQYFTRIETDIRAKRNEKAKCIGLQSWILSHRCELRSKINRHFTRFDTLSLPLSHISPPYRSAFYQLTIFTPIQRELFLPHFHSIRSFFLLKSITADSNTEPFTPIFYSSLIVDWKWTIQCCNIYVCVCVCWLQIENRLKWIMSLLKWIII